MSGPVRVNNADLLAPPVVQTIQQRSLVVGVIFAVMSIIGLLIRSGEFFPAYLLGFMAWLGVTLGCLAILMLQHMAGGAWGLVIRRILEAGTRTLTLMALLFIPLLFGMPKLYVWARADEVAKDKHLQELTHTYLNFSGFLGRAVFYFVIWGVLAYLLNRWSDEQYNAALPDNSRRFRALSGPGLVLYAFCMSFAAIDWAMSLSPHWISTIYPLIFLVGQVLSALGFVVAIETILSRYKPMSELLKPEHVHDHGKLILTFVMLWDYFSLSQIPCPDDQTLREGEIRTEHQKCQDQFSVIVHMLRLQQLRHWFVPEKNGLDRHDEAQCRKHLSGEEDQGIDSRDPVRAERHDPVDSCERHAEPVQHEPGSAQHTESPANVGSNRVVLFSRPAVQEINQQAPGREIYDRADEKSAEIQVRVRDFLQVFISRNFGRTRPDVELRESEQYRDEQ